jgi:putative lipoprotein
MRRANGRWGDTQVLVGKMLRPGHPGDSSRQLVELRAAGMVVTLRDAIPLCLLVAVACGGRAPRSATPVVTGVVRPPERMTVPPDAVVDVQLLDVTRADAPALVLARQEIPTHGQRPPFPFALRYEPATLQRGHRYTVSARIRTAGRLLFVSDSHNTVLIGGAPATVDVAVMPVAE